MKTAKQVLTDLCDCIEATGGILHRDGAAVPLGDPEWSDLEAAYIDACQVLNRVPCLAKNDEPEDIEPRTPMPEAPRSSYAGVEIRFPLSTCNDGGWGADTTDEEAERVARNCAALVEALARRLFPGARVECPVVSDPSPRAWSWDEDNRFKESDPLGYCSVLGDFLFRHWFDEAVWASDFDAEAYLDSIPTRMEIL